MQCLYHVGYHWAFRLEGVPVNGLPGSTAEFSKSARSQHAHSTWTRSFGRSLD